MANCSRFFSLRERLFDLILLVNEGHRKSYEGALDVRFSFPNIYESRENPEPAEQVDIDLQVDDREERVRCGEL